MKSFWNVDLIPAACGVLLCIALGPVVNAGPAEDARAFFDQWVERTNAFDVGIGDLYAPDGRIITLRDGVDKIEMSGTDWKELVAKVMPIAERNEDTNTFEEVKVTARGDGFRITATRTSSRKCAADPNYHLDLARVGDGWQVVEEYTETVSLSRCPPSETLAAALETIRNGIQPHLPLDLDADTRLEAVEVLGPALIYHQRLHTVAASEMDLDSLVPMLRQIAVQNVCGEPRMRALVDAGATVRNAYIDHDGVELANIDITPGLCDLM